MDRKKVVILFSRLSDYMLNVYKLWVLHSDVELYVIRKAIDQKEAPFQFDEILNNIYLYDRESFTVKTMLEKVQDIEPSMILCSGWADKEYLKVISNYSGKIPTVLSMDNQWHGTIRQQIATIVSPFTLKEKFSQVWVPGEPQAKFAKKLGFKEKQISKGFYVANRRNFSRNIINPTNTFTKRFIYVGRYVDIKGIEDMWQAFIELQDESPNEWELYCIGVGPLYEKRVVHDKIKHIGFVQPNELKNYMSEGGIFILPSHFEPWGVVVHEFGLAGFPMIVSDKVGAATQFVKEKENGYLFKSENVGDLKEKMKSMMKLSEDECLKMALKSCQFANSVNEDTWIATANKLLISNVKSR